MNRSASQGCQQLPPRVGQAVDIGGRSLNLYCSGQAKPRFCRRPVFAGSEAGLAAGEKLSRNFSNDLKIHFSLGVLLASHRKYRQAAFEFEKADALQPGSFDILHDLGRAYFLSGDLAKAQGALDQALRLQPDSADTLYWLAQTQTAMQKDVDALELLVRARKLAPGNADILCHRSSENVVF